jgi:hypothetical protein
MKKKVIILVAVYVYCGSWLIAENPALYILLDLVHTEL